MGKRRSQDFNKKNLIMKSIWLGIAVVFFIIGLVVFINMANSGEELGGLFGWLAGGAICCVPIIWQVIKMVGRSTAKGWRDGANTYDTTITVTDTHVTATTQNHPFREAIIGFFGGILGAVIAGLVVLPLFMISNIIYVIRCSVFLAKQKKATTASAE